MASLRITGIKYLAETDNGFKAPVPVLQDPPVAITLATAVATSAAISTPMIMLYAEADCHFTQDGSDATTSDHFIASGERITIGHTSGNVVIAKNTA